jgi:hypothetical protein
MAPLTGLPGVISLCTRGGGWHPRLRRRLRPATALTGAPFDRVVSCADAADAAARAADITRASGLARTALIIFREPAQLRVQRTCSHRGTP